MKVLIINQSEVRQLLPMRECMDVMAEALKTLASGNAILPLRPVLWLPEKYGALGMMPAYLGDIQAMGLKVVSVFPHNHGTEFDSHIGAVMLYETKHGQLLSIMDASEITAIRTAAVSGVATRLLAREDAHTLAILGSGVQAKSHLAAMLEARPVKRVRVWSRNAEHTQRFAERASKRYGLSIEASDSVQAAVDGADIICTTTSAPEPILMGEWIAPGTHINAVGSSVPFTRELDTAAIVKSKMFVDRRESTINEAGDFLFPKKEGAITDDHILGEIGDILLEKIKGRITHDEITLFKSLGLAIEDLASANHIYKKAVEQGVGISVELGGGARMISPISLDDIRAARERIQESVIRTPLIRLNVDNAPAEIYLKLENLQPIGAFKLRGAGNAIALASKEQLAKGVYTASAGNMAQGVAWHARRLGIPCTVIVPDHAPETKLAAITRLGAKFIKVTFDEWWQVVVTHQFPGMEGLFVHPVSDPAVMAGNGTIGLEILEDLPDVDAILIPYGGGGLSCGIASAVRPLKPDTKIYACEVDTSAALAAALAAGDITKIDYKASFVDGIGSGSVLPDMWPLVKSLLDGSLVSSLAEVADAVRTLAERNRVIAEGAGATPVAAALADKAGSGKVVCVVSGGNIDFEKLAKIFKREM